MLLCREGHGSPLQYFCLENPMAGGAWWAAVHGFAKRQTRLSDFTFTFHFHALEKENGNPLQRSCLEDPRDSGAWWAAVCGIRQSQTWLKWLCSSSSNEQCWVSFLSFFLSFFLFFWPSVWLLWRNVILSLYFLIGWFFVLFCLILSPMSCLYILEVNPLSVASFGIIISHSGGCLFILCMVSFAVQKILSLFRPHLFIFVFISKNLSGGSRKILLHLCQQVFYLCFL